MHDSKMTRRKVIGGIGAGLALAATGRVSAAPPTRIPAIMPTTPPSPAPQYRETGSPGLVDPTTKYPRPPFSSQSQPWPGLAGKMDPRPDHGETSYQGSGRLAGRKALITGGDSGMGRAAAIAFAREGADVAISYYPTEEPDAKEVIELIKKEGRKAIPLPGGQTPLGRPGQPAELASIYVQLAASDASYANGQVYGSSGGSGQP